MAVVDPVVCPWQPPWLRQQPSQHLSGTAGSVLDAGIQSCDKGLALRRRVALARKERIRLEHEAFDLARQVKEVETKGLQKRTERAEKLVEMQSNVQDLIWCAEALGPRDSIIAERLESLTAALRGKQADLHAELEQIQPPEFARAMKGVKHFKLLSAAEYVKKCSRKKKDHGGSGRGVALSLPGVSRGVDALALSPRPGSIDERRVTHTAFPLIAAHARLRDRSSQLRDNMLGATYRGLDPSEQQRLLRDPAGGSLPVQPTREAWLMAYAEDSRRMLIDRIDRGSVQLEAKAMQSARLREDDDDRRELESVGLKLQFFGHRARHRENRSPREHELMAGTLEVDYLSRALSAMH